MRSSIGCAVFCTAPALPPPRLVPQPGSSAVALPPPLWKGWPRWIGFYQQRRVKVGMTNEPLALPQPLVPVPSALPWAHLEPRPPLRVWRGCKFSRELCGAGGDQTRRTQQEWWDLRCVPYGMEEFCLGERECAGRAGKARALGYPSVLP